MAFNKLILEGNLTDDPSLRYSQTGVAMASSSIAVNQKYKKKDGSQGEEVLFLKLNFFNRSAETFNQYCHKGSRILVEGKLQNNNWTDNNGNKRYDFVMKVDNFQMLDTRNDAPAAPKPENTGVNAPVHEETISKQYSHTDYQPQQRQEQSPPQPQNNQGSLPDIGIDEDEIPFGYIGLIDKRILHVI